MGLFLPNGSKWSRPSRTQSVHAPTPGRPSKNPNRTPVLAWPGMALVLSGSSWSTAPLPNVAASTPRRFRHPTPGGWSDPNKISRNQGWSWEGFYDFQGVVDVSSWDLWPGKVRFIPKSRMTTVVAPGSPWKITASIFDSISTTEGGGSLRMIAWASM